MDRTAYQSVYFENASERTTRQAAPRREAADGADRIRCLGHRGHGYGAAMRLEHTIRVINSFTFLQPMPTAWVYFTFGNEAGCAEPVATLTAISTASLAAINGELRPVETYCPEQPPSLIAASASFWPSTPESKTVLLFSS